jgi:hypothetical protein
MKRHIGQTWRIKCGLLYAGINARKQAALVAPDDALVFDARDNRQIKLGFYSAMLGVKCEVEELCAS